MPVRGVDPRAAPRTGPVLQSVRAAPGGRPAVRRTGRTAASDRAPGALGARQGRHEGPLPRPGAAHRPVRPGRLPRRGRGLRRPVRLAGRPQARGLLRLRRHLPADRPRRPGGALRSRLRRPGPAGRGVPGRHRVGGLRTAARRGGAGRLAQRDALPSAGHRRRRDERQHQRGHRRGAPDRRHPGRLPHRAARPGPADRHRHGTRPRLRPHGVLRHRRGGLRGRDRPADRRLRDHRQPRARLRFDVFGATLDVYLGRRPELRYGTRRCAGDLLLPLPGSGTVRTLTAREELLRIPGVLDAVLKVGAGDPVAARRASHNASGHVHVSGATIREVEDRMRQVLDAFTIEVVPRVPRPADPPPGGGTGLVERGRPAARLSDVPGHGPAGP
ncbi:hypothetical protein [Streptomyces sp. NPDC004296]|uniref:hypothetical protein n=1 Tax=Streptomyces sp. NPDC004296 TaxID=3364697 RepID=UPI003674AFFD